MKNSDLIKFIIPYWKKGFVPLIYMLISMGLSFLYPLFPKWALDNVVQNKNYDKLLPIVFIFTLVVILEKLFSYLNEISFIKFQQENILKVQADLIKRIFYYPMAFFDKNHSGYLLGRIRGDVSGLNSLFSEEIVINFLSVLQVFIAVPILLSLSVKLTLMCVLLIPLPLIKIYTSYKEINELNKNILEKNSQLSKEMSDVLQGVSDLKIQSKETEGEERIVSSISIYQKTIINRLAYLSKYRNIINLYIKFGQILWLYFGICEIINENMTIGCFIAFSGYLIYLYSPVLNINGLLVTINYAKKSLERLEELLSIIPENNGKKTIKTIRSIKLKNVTFYYNKHNPLIQNFNYSIKKRDKIRIIGRSGSGKSTLIKIILGLYEPIRGDVLFNDINIKELDVVQLRKKIGYISQDVFFFNLSIRENILNDTEMSDKDLLQILDDCKIKNNILSLENGLDTLILEKGENFSGGEKQRLALARALIKNPDIIILDEATGNIDIKTREDIEKMVYKKFKDKIIIVISHNSNKEEKWKIISL